MPSAVASLFEGVQKSHIRPKAAHVNKVGRVPNPVKKEYRALEVPVLDQASINTA